MVNIILTEKQLKLISENYSNKNKQQLNEDAIENALDYMTEIFGGNLKVNIKSKNKK